MSSVTFVVTTYNRPDWLREALRSIPPDAAAIVIDDGSPTTTAASVAFHEGADYRWVSHRGYARARLAGLELVDTEYVAFLDDDDVLMRSWLPLHLDEMAKADVVAASYYETDERLRPLRTIVLEPPTLADFARAHCAVNDGALIRRSVLDGITWHPERDTVMMFSLWHDLLARGARFGVVREPCWYHRLHDGNMSAGIGEQDAAFRAEAVA